MQFREVTWAQQLHFQRLIHGAGAEVTERSLPNYPGAALREIIKQSGHPHNLEPLLLTLRRPANKATRQRFAAVAGELVLIQKVTSSDPIATDFKVYTGGQVSDSADGLLYPTKDTTATFETWLRVEMLDILRLMIEENLVKSLVPEMQYKLISDMLQYVEDPKQHELVRLYSFCVAYAGFKRFHAARPAAVKAGFLRRTAAFLSSIVDKDSLAADSSLAVDPFERLKALVTCIEAVYLLALTNQQGDYTLAAAAAGSSTTAANSSLADVLQQRQVSIATLQEHGVAPLLVQAVEHCWQLLQERDNFAYTPLDPKVAGTAANGHAAESSNDTAADSDEEGGANETEEQKKLRAAAEEAIAAANVSFEENWQNFLKAVNDTELVPSYAVIGVQLGCALLQLLNHQGVPEALPATPVLQQMAAYTQHPPISTTGSILLAAAGVEVPSEAAGDSSTAIMGLLQHQDLELAAFAKLCCACAKPEARDVKLLRCSTCGLTYYCSQACQKADWKAGHKAVCKQLAEVRSKLGAP